MKLTNKHSLPEPLVKALEWFASYRPKPNRISVTTLPNPPQLEAQRRTRWDEIVQDASELVFVLLGLSWHTVLERSADNAFVEEKLEMPVGDWIVSGRPDLLDEHGTLSDYKVTSEYAFRLGDKPEWTAQLNVYRLLYEHYGFRVKELQIVAVLRDWVKRRAMTEADYPPAQALAVPIEMWPLEVAGKYVEDRVRLHRLAIEHGELPECTDEERWYRGESWAVKKRGNKKATKAKIPTFEEAEEWVNNNKHLKGVFDIEYRPGINHRCEYYCPVSQWCEQWATIKPKEEEG